MDDVRGTGLSRGLVGLLQRPIGAADRRRAALHVLDWVGCAAAGAMTPPGIAMIAYGRTMPVGRCRTVGGSSLSSRDAALVNGAMGNVLEMDDFYRAAIVHPGPVVVPAALAIAEEIDASADALLDAVIRGFEAMIRVGRSVGPAHYKYFHNTATCGVFGSAIAAGSLLGLDEDRMVHAIGNAGTQASGLWQCRLEDCMSKQLHNGRAAQSGLTAAQLAGHGFTGARLILEGALGFFRGMCPDGSPETLLKEPDEPWLIHGTSFKPWPACRHTHAAIDAALTLRSRILLQDIRTVVIETYRDAIALCDNPRPRTPVEMKFSLQHACAVVLLRGRPVLEHFDTRANEDADVAALRAKVRVVASDRYTRIYPAHLGTSVQIELRSGQSVRHEVTDPLGDPENPLTTEDLCEKARTLLASAGYSSVAAAGVIGAALALPENGTVAELSRHLT
jgi:2-methylcitrate dehydratase PrpD